MALGYLHAERLPSGLRLNAERARQVIAEQVGVALDLSLADAAYGVYLLGCARMARAVRAVTIERGRDPRDFTLVAFGGNGPLFAAEMARSLEIGAVLVPPAPGVFSALGLLDADVEHHLVRTFLRPLTAETAGEIEGALALLEGEATRLLAGEGYVQTAQLHRFVDLKYFGQSFELTVPLPADWSGGGSVAALSTAFAREHERTYGHAAEGDPIQLVNLRVTARVVQAARPAVRFTGAHTRTGVARAAYFGRAHGTLDTPVLARADLTSTPRPGPLLVDEYDATTLVPPGASARVDEHGNIRILTGGHA